MSLRSLESILRPTLRVATRRPILAVRPPVALVSPVAFVPLRGKKTKASKKSAATQFQEDEDYDAGPGKGKGGKRGKGKLLTEDELTDMQLPGEKFELKVLDERMRDCIDKLRVNLKTVVGRVGRVSPALLDNIRVDSPEGKRPLNEFATVSVKDGKDLLVTCYEEAGVKAVTAALYASPLNLTPQPSGATSIRVPVPKPDWDKRQVLVRDAQELCEKARIAIRQTRNDGQKEIKSDIDAKVIGKEEGRGEGKKLDETTKKRSAEVDKIFEDAKKVLMDE
ncbi:Rrf1p [Sporobolomyces koalae]|uniref:Rrf1p n=1 Tax=Sporobolomyces koalae TaxID=500713 RepID=UPI003180553D